VNLGNGAVHAPARAHFAPMQNKAFHSGGKLHVNSPISVKTEIKELSGGCQVFYVEKEEGCETVKVLSKLG
jgi:hypothetical protein